MPGIDARIDKVKTNTNPLTRSVPLVAASQAAHSRLLPHRQAKEAASSQGGEDAPFEWSGHPEHFAAVIIHHETIIKLKRILLTYMYEGGGNTQCAC